MSCRSLHTLRWLALFVAGAAAQNATAALSFQEDYAKLVVSAEAVQAEAPGVFGESVNLYSGVTEFSVTDVSLPGNSALPVAFGRRYVAEVRGGVPTRYPLGDWDLEVPYLQAVFEASRGWMLDTNGANVGGTTNARCSAPANVDQAMPPIIGTGTQFDLQPEEYWQGTTLYVPGRGGQDVLLLTNSAVSRPTDGATYRWVTNRQWFLSCIALPGAAAGEEGFRARSPDGLVYTFDRKVTLPYPGIALKVGANEVLVDRALVRLYASRVEDRYGNAVTYTWNSSGRLTRIQANDGRRLDVAYNASGKVGSVTDNGGRTWSYTYTAGALVKVALPDKSKWTIDMGAVAGDIAYPAPAVYDGATCQRMRRFTPGGNVRTATLKSPSGATGTFTFDVVRVGRTNVVNDCIEKGADPEAAYNRSPVFFDVVALTKKQISGPGLAAPYTWTYVYPAAVGSVNLNQPAIATRKTVTVLAPDGSRTEHDFGIEFDVNEAQALATRVYASATSTTPLRSEAFVYLSNVDAPAQPFPDRIGESPQSRKDNYFSERLRPLTARTTVQDGQTMSWQANAFDRYVQPTRTVRTGTITKGERSTYDDNTALWVLGQLDTLIDETSDQVEVDNDYDATTASLVRVTQFGRLVNVVGYNPDGTISTVADGTADSKQPHVTTYSNYKRGIAQRVDHADGAYETAVVNDIGAITSVTDALGNTTGYRYDAIGRLIEIAFPAGDTVAWNATTFDFSPVAATELGLTSGHWKQNVTTGAHQRTTYFDALWRPVLTRDYDTGTSAGSYVRYAYDADGRQTFASYPQPTLGKNCNLSTGAKCSLDTGVRSEFDALGRPSLQKADSEQGALSTKYAYLAGFMQEVTNPRGYKTTTAYQVLETPTYAFPVSIAAPERATTLIARDAWGKPISIARQGAYAGKKVSVTRTFVYDATQRLCKSIEPETGATIVDYDLAGNVAWSAAGQALTDTTQCDRTVVDPSAKTLFAYDARNRLTSKAYPSGTESVAWTYYSDGALHATSSAGSSWVYDYNKRRLLERETLTYKSANYRIDWAYDANGALASALYPDGLAVDYAPDALGRPTKVGAFASGVRYHANGAIAGFTYANGVVHSMTPNSRWLPKTSTDTLGTTGVIGYEYAYDGNGNVTGIVDSAQGGLETRSMTYDGLDRLTTANAAQLWGGATFAYDPLDNLRASQVGSRSVTHVYDANNRLVQLRGIGASNIGIGYDAQGNVTKRGTQSFVFDRANRLIEATGKERYAYDGHGRRIESRRSDTNTSRYQVYDKTGQLLFELDAASGKTTNYVYLGNSLVARRDTQTATAPVPVAPVVSAPSTNATGSFDVTWTAVADATSYTVQRNTDSGGWVTWYSGAQRLKRESSLPDGSYSYRAVACNDAGCSAYSNVVTVTVQRVVPGIPTLSGPATSSTGNYKLTWTTPAGAIYFQGQEKTGKGSWVDLATGFATYYEYTDKPSGTYAYHVRACANQVCGGWSNEVSVVVERVTPPPIPTLSVPATSSTGSYRVSWTRATGATSYRLEEKANGGDYAGRYTGADLFADLSGRANGSYTYRIKACNEVGCSDYSAEKTVAVAIPAIPAVPKNLSVPADSLGTYSVTWSASVGAASYQLQESTDDGAHWEAVQSSSATNWSTSNRSPGSYSYRVNACNSAGCSSWSGSVGTTVKPPVPPPPTLSVPATSSTGNFTVTWTSSSYATRYDLTEQVDGSGPWVNKSSGTQQSYVATNYGSGTYGYRVRACNSSGCSTTAGTGQIEVTLPGALPTPTGLRGPSGQLTSPVDYTIRWNSVAGATRYDLEEIKSCGPVTTVYETTPANYDVGWSPCGPVGSFQTFTYRVRACAAQCSPWSAAIVVDVRIGPDDPQFVPPSSTAASVVTTSAITYYHTDALGSPVATTDANGTVLSRTRYEPYGAPADGVYRDGPGYAGRAMDSATSLVYMQQRYFDPISGRFISTDPVTVNDGGGNFNRYSYANNNPYKNVDPDGRTAIVAVIGCAASAPACVATVVVGTVIVAGTVYFGARAINHTVQAVQEGESKPAPSDQPADSGGKSGGESEGGTKPGDAFPDRELPRKPNGEPAADSDAEGAYTQLGTKEGSKGKYPQAREFDGEGKAVRDIDFTDHGRPGAHVNPHEHPYSDNATGGTRQRGPARPVRYPEESK